MLQKDAHRGIPKCANMAHLTIDRVGHRQACVTVKAPGRAAVSTLYEGLAALPSSQNGGHWLWGMSEAMDGNVFFASRVGAVKELEKPCFLCFTQYLMKGGNLDCGQGGSVQHCVALCAVQPCPGTLRRVAQCGFV
eukprot:1158426-Pelagomonas_calceolata.AAC.16